MASGRKFAVFDLDGALIRWQLYHSVTDTLARLGHISPELHQTVKDARMIWKRRAGEFGNYERQVIKVYDTVIKQLSREQLEVAANAVFEEYKDQTYTYTRNLIKDLKAKNYLLFAISGSQSEIVEKIANYHGFDDFKASIYKYANGRFTGSKRVVSFHKDKALQALLDSHNVTLKASIAVGDTNSDIVMMEMVEQPIAFNPEQRLYNHALSQGWQIVIERKNVIYQLENLGESYELVKAKA